MDRLAKKCVIASGIMHGTLVLVLLVGPAFLSSNDKPDTTPILTIIPDIAIASGSAVMGAGNPNAGRSAPTPPPAPKPPDPVPPAPAPIKPEPPVKPDPKPPVEAKPVESKPAPDRDSLEPSNKPRKPVVSLKQVVRNSSNNKTTRTSTSSSDTSASDNKRFQTAMNNIQRGASSGVEIGPVGIATGSGPSMAPFEQILKSIYFNNWREPADATSDEAVVKASVTIASDGTVLNARITRSSGDPAVDRSVRQLLEAVTYIAPFPPGSKEKQRTYPLSFSLKAKRGLG